MSLVIYHGGKLYADTRAWGGVGVPSPGAKDKVLVAKNGDLIGITTAALGMPTSVLNTYNLGATWVDGGDFRAIVLKEDGHYFWSDDTHIVGPLEAPFYAVGTGAKYALGALEHGATIEEAFKCASVWDEYTDSTFRTFERAPVTARPTKKKT